MLSSSKVIPERQESLRQVTSAAPGPHCIHDGFVGSAGILASKGFEAGVQASGVVVLLSFSCVKVNRCRGIKREYVATFS